MKRFYIQTMGCKSNQFETALVKENLINNGFEESDDIKNADFYILNSCSVTHKSDNEAFYLLRTAKNKNSNIRNVLTGCIAQIEKEKLLEYDFVDYVIGNDDKLNLYKYLNEGNTLCVSDIMHQDKFSEVALSDLSKTRASLKVQDGCDNRCSYCIIWKARGKSRSASLDFVVNQINNFSKSGFKEVVITGIHIGQWGKDIGLGFIDLVKAIEERTSIERFRLGSLNPTEINDDLIEYLSKSKKFCPHFHLSLQSANDKTLKSMNRFYSVDLFLNQIEQIKNTFENVFIGSDIIAGFAGETGEDFQITVENLKKSGLTQIHTFPYSVRHGTVGESMPDQVSDSVKVERANVIKSISKEKYSLFVKNNINTLHEVLIEKHRDKHSGNLKGVTRNYLTVQINSDREDLYNTLQNVKIIDYKNGILYAELV